MKLFFKGVTVLAFSALSMIASAQKYPNGIIDKTIAVVGNEVIMISQLEDEVQMMRAYGMMSDKGGRCEILESMMSSKLFLMQARLDSLTVNNDHCSL
jgi:peptidyl-prolyl cis-trans isomerase SurA